MVGEELVGDVIQGDGEGKLPGLAEERGGEEGGGGVGLHLRTKGVEEGGVGIGEGRVKFGGDAKRFEGRFEVRGDAGGDILGWGGEEEFGELAAGQRSGGVGDVKWHGGFQKLAVVVNKKYRGKEREGRSRGVGKGGLDAKGFFKKCGYVVRRFENRSRLPRHFCPPPPPPRQPKHTLLQNPLTVAHATTKTIPLSPTPPSSVPATP